MTTHYQKIQALGNRMAENLTIMGVPSQFDEGGLTLADKILEISSGITTGLLLYGDKKVAQSGDTVNLSMMVLEDGEFQPNTNVILHETILDKTYSTYSSISKSIGDNWVIEGPFENIISSSDTSGTTITAWGNGKLTVSVGGATVYHDSEAGSISKISYINKILSYNNKTVDLTEYNASFNVLSNVNAGRIIVKTAYVLTTDTHGLATHAYTCSGSGLREFYATSGTFVSETYNVLDCLAYDKGLSGEGNHNDSAWDMTYQYCSFERGTEYSTFTSSDSSYESRINLLNIGVGSIVELEACQVNGTYGNGFITIVDTSVGQLSYFSFQDMGYTSSNNPVGTFVKLKLEIGESSVTITSVDDPTKTKTKTYALDGTPNRVRFRSIPNSIRTIRLREVKVY